MDLHCLSKRFQRHFADDESRRLVLIGSLRVNKYEFSVFTVKIFMKYAHVCAAQTTY